MAACGQRLQLVARINYILQKFIKLLRYFMPTCKAKTIDRFCDVVVFLVGFRLS
jgi:hypothetical protein